MLSSGSVGSGLGLTNIKLESPAYYCTSYTPPCSDSFTSLSLARTSSPSNVAVSLADNSVIRVKRMRRMSSEPEDDLREKTSSVPELQYYSGSPLQAGGWTQTDIDQATSIGIPTTSYYTGSSDGHEAPGSPVKYHETGTNGHDTFSDFVTLVCQEAGQPPASHNPKSPTKLVSYYSSSMFPPAPTPPMARPVPVKIPETDSPPPLNMQISPSHSDREVRLSPDAPRTILYTYSGGGTISIPENLSPANLSIVQPPRVCNAGKAQAPTAIRWTTSNGSFISDIDSSGIAYDLMTPMISGASSDNNPGASLQLNDGECDQLLQIVNLISWSFQIVTSPLRWSRWTPPWLV